MDLSGVAFVTGGTSMFPWGSSRLHWHVLGGSGIGKACALSFARCGVSGLVVADIDLDAAKATIIECQSVASNRELRTEAVCIDVASEDSVGKVIMQVVGTLGRIDYCVHAAGVRVQPDRPQVVIALALLTRARFPDRSQSR